jgi:hypothetical protein
VTLPTDNTGSLGPPLKRVRGSSPSIKHLPDLERAKL